MCNRRYKYDAITVHPAYINFAVDWKLQIAILFKLFFLADELIWRLSYSANTSLVNTTLCNGWFFPSI
jgi:hypothetical protein